MAQGSASVGRETAHRRRSIAGRPPSSANPLALSWRDQQPGPEATHRWRGRTLVDHHGEPLGTIEIIYLDKATNQPEWALLEAGATGPAEPSFPWSAPARKATPSGSPSPNPGRGGAIDGADRELSEDQEGELYRHYGALLPGRLAKRPPAGDPEPAEPALAAGQAQPAEEPVSTSTPEVAAGKPQVPAAEPATAAEEPLPAGGGALPGLRCQNRRRSHRRCWVSTRARR